MDHRGVPHFIEANLMPGLRKGYFYRSCLLNLNMSYEKMILTVADNGLSSQRIHFPSTKQLKGHPTTERSFTLA
jgi:D-alanine-D-alanine ligase